ncbi:DUF998 domain-containing protein [Streptomyces tagetis]|uniref:DUF998 domain-containing protein n=1 Tax=Streptomyces tagetis TaxID=2820809 RepID=A0A940XJ36_9ACTN|nr:DUF998 domain-containing protein [Streptomyces sp. RG38]MBQ0825464.1 DUF998 domain-containing protein [Streptomyces sp. RG38]
MLVPLTFLSPRGAVRRLDPHSPGSAAHGALAGSLALAAALHLGWAAEVDPLRHTLSDYALHDGAAALFTACAGSAAAGCGALLAGLVRSRATVGTGAPAALAVGCAGLTLCALFPTDPVGRPSTASGLIHRYATGTALAALPAAGLLLARRLRARPAGRDIGRLAWASSAAALLFLGTHLSVRHPVTPAAWRAAGLLGLAERVTLGLEFALLFTMAGTLRGAGRPG